MDSHEVGQITVGELRNILSDIIDTKGLAKKEDLENINVEIASLKKENQDLRKEINSLHALVNLSDRNSRRNNLIFGGIDLQDGNALKAIQDFIRQVLKIEQPIIIGRAFALGRTGLRRRPILVELVRGEDLYTILSRVSELKGTTFFIHRDYSQQERIKRAKLVQVKKEILKQRPLMNIVFRREALLIKEVPYIWDLDKGLMTASGLNGVEALRAAVGVNLDETCGSPRMGTLSQHQLEP
ncbi:hypothetical protein GE061_009454 [Apolygus lucorum]|uniref:Uncharacterized protein n=1 Tax=Apolygus lucorum TaxID=248454 RepID=A0A8S9Y2B3_APOLU|nr:hypothetical protein GE061_009454 [Apolygus lucorum]